MAQHEVNGRCYPMPDFIIGGAMKCATTTLHEILATHPRIFIPPGELKFFSLDDFMQQPEFAFPTPDGTWNKYSLNEQDQHYLRWYADFFSDSPEAAILGEDTPTYLASELAPDRISEMAPNTKLIFLLREPVARTYSHYWHWVRSGRTPHHFEQAIRQQAYPLLQRSFYFEQLQRYHSLFKAEQIRVVLFEQFIAEPQKIVSELCDFLGVTPLTLQIEKQSNPGSIPRFHSLQLMHNWMTFPYIGYKHLPFLPGNGSLRRPLYIRTINRIHNAINPMRHGKPRPMRSGTREFLTDYLVERNRGLSKLLGFSLVEYWGDAYAAV